MFKYKEKEKARIQMYCIFKRDDPTKPDFSKKEELPLFCALLCCKYRHCS